MRHLITLFIFIFTLLFNVTFPANATVKEMSLQKEKIFIYIPQIINPKYFGFEFGFATTKKIGRHYFYNAFAKAFVLEEPYSVDPNLRAGALGGKTGILLPTNPWLPLYLEMAIGFAKTALHKDPWLGMEDKTSQRKTMFLAEAGVGFRIKEKFLIRLNYVYNNVKYFIKKSYISLGINF